MPSPSVECYGSGMTWWWVIEDRTFVFGWTNPLRSINTKSDVIKLSKSLRNCAFTPNAIQLIVCSQFRIVRWVSLIDKFHSSGLYTMTKWLQFVIFFFLERPQRYQTDKSCHFIRNIKMTYSCTQCNQLISPPTFTIQSCPIFPCRKGEMCFPWYGHKIFKISSSHKKHTQMSAILTAMGCTNFIC